MYKIDLLSAKQILDWGTSTQETISKWEKKNGGLGKTRSQVLPSQPLE